MLGDCSWSGLINVFFQYRHAREASNSIAQGSDALQDAAAISEKLRRAADIIRAAAPALLEPAQDDVAQQHGRRVDLESHVTFLDQLSNAMAPRSWRPGEQAGLDRWTPSMMISMVLEARLLKSQTNLRRCLLHALNTIAPPPQWCVRHWWRGCWRSSLFPVHSRSVEPDSFWMQPLR